MYFGPTIYEGTSSFNAALGLFGQLQLSNSHLVAEHLFLRPWGNAQPRRYQYRSWGHRSRLPKSLGDGLL